MKYYSEITNKVYNDTNELVADEIREQKAIEERQKAIQEKKEKLQVLQEQRAERAKQIEEAYRIADKAQQDADKLLSDFLKDYKTFHSTATFVKPRLTFFNMWDRFFNEFI